MEFPKFTQKYHTTVYDAIDPTIPELSASGKVVVVTGGGSGIGPAIATAFAQASASYIAILGRTEKTLFATKSAIEQTSTTSTVSTFIADVGDKSVVDKVFATIHSQNGPIDILVNNAGYLPNLNRIKDESFDEWQTGFRTNVEGAFNVTKAFLRTAADDPILINISTSVTHLGPLPGYAAYGASKIAALKFFDYVQCENPDVRVINVQPGLLETGMAVKAEAAGYKFNYDDGMFHIRVDLVRLPGSFVVWAASPEASFLKGKFVWVNWDVEELKARKDELSAPGALTIGLNSWP
jgi:NAD(P)-dependent dehydrogenase (short-subunit alcohol dehydrogenase family)